MKRNRRVWGKRLTAGALALWLTGTAALPIYAESTDVTKQNLLDALNVLSTLHVSGTSSSALSDAAIKGMVDSLKDPYTTYMSAEEMKQFTDSLEQQYVGIGVRFEPREQGMYIAEVFTGSPASEGGIQVGDIITGADDYTYHTDGFKNVDEAAQEMSKHVLGEAGTSVKLTLERNGESMSISLIRKQIQLPEVESHAFPGGIGYIRIATFSSDADEETARQLKELGSLNGLILDLRDNPGGLLDTASGIAKLFIKEGILIHTKDRDKVDVPVEIHGGASVPYPVYVIVNENSASASEVLTGALQDYGIAKVVGAKSFGKGSVQQLIPLSGGGMLKVTVEEYFTPKGHPVNHIGIVPNVEVDGGAAQLLTALRLAGQTSLSLKVQPDGIVLDGVKLPEYVPVEYDSAHANEPMVPARIAAALLGLQVEWEQETSSVLLTDKEHGGAPVRFNQQNEGLALIDGTGFVPLSRVKAAFPNLHSEKTTDGLVIGVDGGTN